MWQCFPIGLNTFGFRPLFLTRLGCPARSQEKERNWLPTTLPKQMLFSTHRHWCNTHESLGPVYWLGHNYPDQIHSDRPLSSLPESQAHNSKQFASHPMTTLAPTGTLCKCLRTWLCSTSSWKRPEQSWLNDSTILHTHTQPIASHISVKE